MAAAAFRNPTRTPDENRIPSQRLAADGVTRRGSGRSSGANPASMNYEHQPDYLPQPSHVPRSISASHKNNPVPVYDDRRGRSFAARTRDPPLEMNRLAQPEVSNLPNDHGDIIADPSPVQEDVQMASPVDSGSQPTSSSRRSARDQRHGWAHDRSPLQKLEVTLDGISKEEKRARAQEAERKLQERMARKTAENEGREVPSGPRSLATAEVVSPKAVNLEPTASNRRPKGKPAAPRGGDIQVSKRQGGNRELGSERKRPPDDPKFIPNRAQSLQYPTVLQAEEPQYAKNEQPTRPVRRGSVPRKPVAASYQPAAYIDTPPQAPGFPQATATPGTQARPLPIPRVAEQTSAKKQGPPLNEFEDRQTRPMQTTRAPYRPGSFGERPKSYPSRTEGDNEPVLNATTDLKPYDESPGQVREARDGPPSQSKPKRQTVSFNVPPPTPPPLSEWKNAPTARLNASDFDFQNFDVDKSKAWWEGGGSTDRRKSRALPNAYQKPTQKPQSKHLINYFQVIANN